MKLPRVLSLRERSGPLTLNHSPSQFSKNPTAQRVSDSGTLPEVELQSVFVLTHSLITIFLFISRAKLQLEDNKWPSSLTLCDRPKMMAWRKRFFHAFCSLCFSSFRLPCCFILIFQKMLNRAVALLINSVTVLSLMKLRNVWIWLLTKGHLQGHNVML